jgi:cytoplasmic iron level regulating protein YaaA (DUF328/UPF0246 family)
VAGLALPGLAPVRRRVLRHLVALCKGRRETALAVLGLSPGQADAIVGNRALRTAPTLSAAERYTGVLYDNLSLATLDGAARERAAESILIFSGLWGAVRLDDRIPHYRLAMGVTLPPLGPLAAVWRPALGRALRGRAGGRLIVDMRSAPYAAAWRPDGPAVAVRVVREQITGGVVRRSVVSHMAKATRGVIARDLVVSGAEPQSPGELAKVLSDLGHVVEMEEPARAQGPCTAVIVLGEQDSGHDNERGDPDDPTRSGADVARSGS